MGAGCVIRWAQHVPLPRRISSLEPLEPEAHTLPGPIGATKYSLRLRVGERVATLTSRTSRLSLTTCTAAESVGPQAELAQTSTSSAGSDSLDSRFLASLGQPRARARRETSGPDQCAMIQGSIELKVRRNEFMAAAHVAHPCAASTACRPNRSWCTRRAVSQVLAVSAALKPANAMTSLRNASLSLKGGLLYSVANAAMADLELEPTPSIRGTMMQTQVDPFDGHPASSSRGCFSEGSCTG